MLRRAAPIAILIAAIWVTFSPALTFSFLNWDHDVVVGVRRRRAWRRSRAIASYPYRSRPGGSITADPGPLS